MLKGDLILPLLAFLIHYLELFAFLVPLLAFCDLIIGFLLTFKSNKSEFWHNNQVKCMNQSKQIHSQSAAARESLSLC